MWLAAGAWSLGGSGGGGCHDWVRGCWVLGVTVGLFRVLWGVVGDKLGVLECWWAGHGAEGCLVGLGEGCGELEGL